ncbi:hypothetical protein FAIPA1_110101 [Frankia sp. AiPs1]
MHSGHAHQVGAEHAQHADLRGRLVLRAGQAGVDAFGERRVDLAGERTQPRRVGVGQVDEPRPDQRGPSGEVQMVGDEHRLADTHVGAQAARRVRQHDCAGAGRARQTDGVHHPGQLVSLVGMHPAEEDEHPAVPETHRPGRRLMPGNGRRAEREAAELREPHVDDLVRLVREDAGRWAPTGTQHDRDVVPSGAGQLREPRRRCCRVRLLCGVGSMVRLRSCGLLVGRLRRLHPALLGWWSRAARVDYPFRLRPGPRLLLHAATVRGGGGHWRSCPCCRRIAECRPSRSNRASSLRWCCAAG